MYEVEQPVIRQLIRFDAEGDGVHEVLVVAEETEILPEASDVYSVMFLRRLVDGDVETTVVGSSVIPPEDTGFPAALRVGAIADLSGDGVMEIVLSAVAWEGGSIEVHELTSDGIERRLAGACGV